MEDEKCTCGHAWEDHGTNYMGGCGDPECCVMEVHGGECYECSCQHFDWDITDEL